MTDQPLVSVLMTAYNREKYIAEAIESVLESSYSNFELIIVDDGSMDDTVNIARSFETKDNRIRVYVNETNLGDYPNRNKATTYARGEFLMFVDSDDKILSGGIKDCIEAMLQFPQSSFGMYYPGSTIAPFLIETEQAIRKHFFETPFLFIGPGGTILRRSFFELIGKYPEKYGPANDMYFNLKATCYSPIVLLPFEIIFYRRHEGQEINNKESYLVNNYRYLRDALNELPLSINKEQKEWVTKKSKRRFTMNILKYFFKTFNLKKTVSAIKQARFTFSDAVTGIFH